MMPSRSLHKRANALFVQPNKQFPSAKYLLPKPSGHPRATMSDDGFDGGGVGDDYDYGGGYVNLVIRSFWSINTT